MDDVNQADAAQAPRLRLPAEEPLPANFSPMRLVLAPSGMTLDVNRPDMLVGRHSECDIRLPLPDVSRRHCRLLFVEGCWQVVDLNSLNGIQVNGEQVLQAPLEQGDLLRIGGFTFSVDLTPTAGKAAIHATQTSQPLRKAS